MAAQVDGSARSGGDKAPGWASLALAAALLGALLVWVCDAGHDAIERARVHHARLRDAVSVADALGQAAGRRPQDAEALPKAVTDLERRHGHRLGRAVVVGTGGVDEFGIARGSDLWVGADGLDARRRALTLEHAARLGEVATDAAAKGAQVGWGRLQAIGPEGALLVAVPFRHGDDQPPAGVAGVWLPAADGGLALPAWRWALALLLPIFALLLAKGRFGLPPTAVGASAGALCVAALLVTLPPLTAPGGDGGVQVLAAQLLVPHAGAPVQAALDAAETWLAALLVGLGLVGGAIVPACATVFSAMRRDPAPYLYVGPSLAATGALVFFPFAVGVGLSLTGVDGEFVGLANYQAVLATLLQADESAQLGRTLAHTALWTVLNVAFHVVLGLGLALLLNRPNLRFRKGYRLLLIVPWAVPSYITALTWKWLFNTQYGPINTMLAALGLERVDWLAGSGFTAFFANLATNVWLGFPFMMVISLGALQSIPADLYEAADIDGATGWQKLRHVTLPLLKPALFPAIILGTIWTFNAFNIIYLVSGGGPDHSTEILITEAYHLFTVLRRTGLAAAYAVLIFGLLMAYTLITNRLTRATEAVDR